MVKSHVLLRKKLIAIHCSTHGAVSNPFIIHLPDIEYPAILCWEALFILYADLLSPLRATPLINTTFSDAKSD